METIASSFGQSLTPPPSKKVEVYGVNIFRKKDMLYH